jgi:hypothetical protein
MGDIPMLNGKTIAIAFAVGLFASAACNAQSLEENWNDYLHYALIGRLDMAKAHARAILEGRSDPVALFDLSQANPQGYALLLRAKETPHEPELAQLSGELYNMIELGRFLRRTDPEVIVEEIKRLSTTERGRATATTALQNAGEYAIPFMLDALADRNRKEEWIHITQALPKIGRDAIRPLTAALQTDDLSVKADIVKALGDIRYPQALPYLKYVTEKEQSSQLRGLAGRSITQINPPALNMPAAELFYRLAQDYYYHAESLAPAEDAEFGNVWFWDADTARLTSEKVDKGYFYELMAMHECEWALKADPGFGQAIGLWLAAYFKAESTNIEMPNYRRHDLRDNRRTRVPTSGAGQGGQGQQCVCGAWCGRGVGHHGRREVIAVPAWRRPAAGAGAHFQRPCSQIQCGHRHCCRRTKRNVPRKHPRRPQPGGSFGSKLRYRG